MKYGYILRILAVIVLFSAFSLSYAENSDVNKNDDDIQVGRNSNLALGTSSDDVLKLKTNQDNATGTKETNRNNNASTTNNNNGQFTSEGHRSVVATFVKSLLDVANREGGIGLEVREIAKSQNDSASTTIFAMKKVEGKGSFTIFMFGSDYRNLGVIRSNIATTSNNIARLKNVLDKTADVLDRAELNIQIKALETEQIKLNTYVTNHQNIFSLFGWFNKMFVK